MNIGQSSSFKKIKWCGAAKHNTHGKGKKRLTFQRFCAKKPPARSKRCANTKITLYNQGIIASETARLMPREIAPAGLKASGRTKNPALQAFWLGRYIDCACAIRMQSIFYELKLSICAALQYIAVGTSHDRRFRSRCLPVQRFAAADTSRRGRPCGGSCGQGRI